MGSVTTDSIQRIQRGIASRSLHTAQTCSTGAWISVVTLPNDPDLTDWTLAAQGFRFHWKARITQRVEAQQLHWESVGGLPTKGAVRFYPQDGGCTAVKLSVSYELPAALAPLMEPTILGGIVTKELQANLDRFRDLVESDAGASGASPAPAAGGLPGPA